jgi:hypothetical protein
MLKFCATHFRGSYGPPALQYTKVSIDPNVGIQPTYWLQTMRVGAPDCDVHAAPHRSTFVASRRSPTRAIELDNRAITSLVELRYLGLRERSGATS